MADNKNTPSVFQNITSDYTENVRRIMELAGSENMKLTNAINALNSRIAAMGQQAALRSIGLSEQLTNKRMQDLNLMAQAYRAHYEAFGGVLDDAALSFLDTHANIDAPTFTSIMAGYEHARASRAKNALAQINAQGQLQTAQYETQQRHLQNYMKSQEAMMSSELQNLKNQQNIILQQMKNNESMANALVRAETAGLNARQRAEAAALRAGGASRNGMAGLNAARYFTRPTREQELRAQAQQMRDDYSKSYGQPIEKEVKPPRMSTFTIEPKLKSDNTIVIPLYSDYTLGDGLREIAEENDDMSIKLQKEKQKFMKSSTAKDFGDAAGDAFDWLVDYAKFSKDKSDIITRLSNGQYDYSRSKQLQEIQHSFERNFKKDPELSRKNSSRYPNYSVYLPNVQLYIANELLRERKITAKPNFQSVMSSDENVFFDQPDIEEAMKYMAEKGGNELTSLFEVRTIGDSIRTYDDRVERQYDYGKIMSELGESTQSSQETQGGQQSDVILMDMIDAPESGRNYNIYNYRVPRGANRYRGVTSENLTNMTVGQIMERGKKGREHFYAAGAHQIIPKTLEGVVKAGAIGENDLFNELTQDKAFAYIAKEAAGKYITGENDNINYAGDRLANQWRVLISPLTGKGYGIYDNATVKADTVLQGLRSARKRYQYAREQNIDPEQSFHYAVTGKLYSNYQQ